MPYRAPYPGHRILATSIAGALVVLTATALGAHRETLDWPAALLVHQFRLQSENVIGVWFASMLFFGTALLFWRAAIHARRLGRARSLVAGYAAVAAVAALLSLDELGSIHERLGQLPELGPLATLGWVSVLAVPIGVVAIGVVLFGVRIGRERPAAGLLLGLGAFLLATVPLQEVIEAYRGRSVAGALLEEGTEVAGALAFLAAGFLLTAGGGEDGRKRLNRKLVAAAVLVGSALGAGLAEWAVGRLPDRGGLGDPARWFIAAPAFYAGVRLLFGGGRGPGRAALGIAMLVMSADAGAAAAISDEILTGSPDARMTGDLLLLAALATCVLLVRHERLLTGAATVGWALAAVAWVFVPVPGKWGLVLVSSALAISTRAASAADPNAAARYALPPSHLPRRLRRRQGPAVSPSRDADPDSPGGSAGYRNGG